MIVSIIIGEQSYSHPILVVVSNMFIWLGRAR